MGGEICVCLCVFVQQITKQKEMYYLVKERNVKLHIIHGQSLPEDTFKSSTAHLQFMC